MLTILYRRLWMQSQSYKIMLAMTLIALVINFAFAGMNQNYEPALDVVDLDGTVMSAAFAARLSEIDGQRVTVMDALDEKRVQMKVAGALVIHEGFSAALVEGKVPRLELVTLKQDAEVMTLEYNIERAFDQFMAYRSLALDFEAAAAEAGVEAEDAYERTYSRLVEVNDARETLKVVTEGGSQRDLNAEIGMYRILGFLIMFTAFTTVIAAAEIVEEKHNYTWQRTLVAPVRRLGIIAGHVAVAFVVGMIQLVVTLMAGQYLFGLEFGANMGGLLAVGALYILTMGAFGLFVTSFAKSPNALGGIVSILLTSMAMLGGCMWPLEMVSSKILIALSWITPHRWAFDAMRAIGADGVTLASQSFELMMLAAMTVLMMGVGVLRLRAE